MLNFINFLTFSCENEHVLEHDPEHNLLVKKNYSVPKIYNANGDLNKRWYLYFSFRDPVSGKLKRMKNIYGITNNFKTKEERFSILSTYRRNLIILLKKGFNPFEDNSELLNKNNSSETEVQLTINKVEPKIEPQIIPETEKQQTIKEAFEFALDLKKNVINITSFRGLNNRMKTFLSWIETTHPELLSINSLNKKIVTNFLNHKLSESSARNRNNFRTDLSSLIQMLEDNEIIAHNFVKSIPVLKSIPKRNKTYSNELQQNIYSHLEKEDPLLLLYIKFISYNFLRPIEVCRLKIKDINLKERKVQFQAKNSPLKTKIIPEILFKELPDLSKFDPELHLFTPNQIGGTWDASINNKRDYFSKRFKKVAKDHFKLGVDYGLYSFRHTFITKLYREIAKTSTPFEAKSKLMLITGHSSMDALQKYLRDIDAELPEDCSELLKPAEK